MTMTIKSQRFEQRPNLAPGAELVCKQDGYDVRLVVTAPQPMRDGGCWVNRAVGSTPAVVWVTW